MSVQLALPAGRHFVEQRVQEAQGALAVLDPVLVEQRYHPRKRRRGRGGTAQRVHGSIVDDLVGLKISKRIKENTRNRRQHLSKTT